MVALECHHLLFLFPTHSISVKLPYEDDAVHMYTCYPQGSFVSHFRLGHLAVACSGKKQLAVSPLCWRLPKVCCIKDSINGSLHLFHKQWRGKSLNYQVQSLNKSESDKHPSVNIDIQCSRAVVYLISCYRTT